MGEITLESIPSVSECLSRPIIIGVTYRVEKLFTQVTMTQKKWYGDEHKPTAVLQWSPAQPVLHLSQLVPTMLTFSEDVNQISIQRKNNHIGVVVTFFLKFQLKKLLLKYCQPEEMISFLPLGLPYCPKKNSNILVYHRFIETFRLYSDHREALLTTSTKRSRLFAWASLACRASIHICPLQISTVYSLTLINSSILQPSQPFSQLV